MLIADQNNPMIKPGHVTSCLKALHNSSVKVISQTHKWAHVQDYLNVPQHTTAIVLGDDGQWPCLYILNVNGKMMIHNQYLVIGIVQTPIIPHQSGPKSIPSLSPWIWVASYTNVLLFYTFHIHRVCGGGAVSSCAGTKTDPSMQKPGRHQQKKQATKNGDWLTD